MSAWTRFAVLAAGTLGLLHPCSLFAAPPDLPPDDASALAPSGELAPTPVAPAPAAPAPAPDSVEPAPSEMPIGPQVGDPTLEGEPLRIVEGPPLPPEPSSELVSPASSPELASPELAAPELAALPSCPMPRSVAKRPPVGTGMLVGAIAGFVGASMMVTLATLGRNELGLRGNQALPLGLSAVPLTAISGALLVGGIKGTQRYAAWKRDNAIDAPASGNGMLVAGLVLAGVGATATALAVDRARGIADPDAGDRALTGVSIATLGSGVLLLGGGVIQRARFSAWEGVGYLRPGVYANSGGAGLALSGRF